MSIKRWAARRDANDSEIARQAGRIGWYLIKLDTPCDYLGCLIALQRWFPVEIKAPKGTFSAAQKLFRSDCSIWSMPYLVWRSIDQMVADTNQIRRGALTAPEGASHAIDPSVRSATPAQSGPQSTRGRPPVT
jgi:hypothetical protein